MKDFGLIVNGRRVAGAATIDVINPATEEAFAACPVADPVQLEEAIAAARSAFRQWSAMPVDERRHLMGKVADEIEVRAEELTDLLTTEQGKPLAQARREILRSAMTLRHFAGAEIPARVLRDTAEERIYERRTALGVVAAITPWNFPVLLLMNKLGPALLTGNTVVAKPAPTTPLTTLRIGEICADILPPGVVNVICDRNDLGAMLTSHPDIAKVSFTGSTATGRKVFESAAPTIKRLTLELGGNDAALVLDDADPDVVAPKIFATAMANAGQVCMAVKRVYVPASLENDIVDRLAAMADSMVVGDGKAPETEMGPVQNAAQHDKLTALLAETSMQGEIVTAQRKRNGPGYFISPTIVRNIADEAPLVRDEQFGPVLPVLSYTDVDEAVDRINRTDFGLGASVWTGDPDRGVEIGERLVSGTLWINRHLVVDPAIPFRGNRQSGFGAELGEAGIEEFTQPQVVNIAKQ